MYCPNCGRKVKDSLSYCPYCGYRIRRASEELIDHRSYQPGYIDEIVNSSLGTRMTTAFGPLLLLFLLMVLLLALIVAYGSDIGDSTIDDICVLLSLLAVIVIIVAWFSLAWPLVSRRGLTIINNRITPRYRKHMHIRHPEYSLNMIDKLGPEHYKKIANACRTITYAFGGLVTAVFAIYIFLIGLVIAMIFGGICGALGPTWHSKPKWTGLFSKTHWYY